MTIAQDSAAFRFLVEEFSEVGEDAAPAAVARFQREASATLGFGGAPPLTTLEPAEFQRLRSVVRDWLRSLVLDPIIAFRVTFQESFSAIVIPEETPGRLRVTGDAHDVFWFHVVGLIHRVGVSRVGVCYAPQANHARRPCGRLYMRRGSARRFCSDRCRARVATQRARGIEAAVPMLDKALDEEWRRLAMWHMNTRGEPLSRPLVVSQAKLRRALKRQRRRKTKGGRK